MIKYKFKINEEITRWVTEVYVNSNPDVGWWIAFTNPTAGPWKKITAPNESGECVEVYRFNREEERPDLVLVNDKLKQILIIEAKDYCKKLITEAQMKKSIRVIDDMSSLLSECNAVSWRERKNYKITPSFLWFSKDKEDIKPEDKLVTESFRKYAESNTENVVNIIVSANDKGALENNFFLNGLETKDLVAVS